MQYEISNRMSDVHGSAIRELFKLGTDPNMILSLIHISEPTRH